MVNLGEIMSSYHHIIKPSCHHIHRHIVISRLCAFWHTFGIHLKSFWETVRKHLAAIREPMAGAKLYGNVKTLLCHCRNITCLYRKITSTNVQNVVERTFNCDLMCTTTYASRQPTGNAVPDKDPLQIPVEHPQLKALWGMYLYI